MGHISNSLDPFRHYVDADKEMIDGWFSEDQLEKTGGRVKLPPLQKIRLHSKGEKS